MKESLEELKAIRDGAPEGATHINTIIPKELNIINYINANNLTWWHGGTDEWKSFGGMVDVTFRSLSDINRIIELMEKINDNSDERINQIARDGEY